MRRKASSLLTALVAATALAGCGDGTTLIIVTARNVSADVVDLGALPSLNGKAAQEAEVFSSTAPFGIRLAAGSSGVVSMFVAGIDGDGCIVSTGTADQRVSGEAQLNMDVVLSRMAMKRCP